MDWSSYNDPFLYPNHMKDFTCLERETGGLKCTVLESYATDDESYPTDDKHGNTVRRRVLRNDQDWVKWFQDCPLFSNEEDFRIPSVPNLPRNGLCILTIPRAERIPSLLEIDLKLLPLSQERWNKIGKAFRLLPGYISTPIREISTSITLTTRNFNNAGDDDSTEHQKEQLWMHAFTTSHAGPDPFVVIFTYFKSTQMTLAIMIGCSAQQIDKVQEFIDFSQDATQHPLLILAICAELQLVRLKILVKDRESSCFRTMSELAEANRLGPNRKYNGDIPKLISDVCDRREAIKMAKGEVEATKRQLIKALPSFLNSATNSFGTDYGTPTNLPEPETDESKDLTDTFHQRFADIFAELERLVSRCETVSDSMSFSAGIMQTELSRKDAKNSAVIAFVAMLFAPMSTIATIFSMPVFQFANNWRNWRFQPMDEGHSASSNSTEVPSTTGNAADLPVFSGYFWIYLGTSISLTVLTILSWYVFTSRETSRERSGERTRGRNPKTNREYEKQQKKGCLLRLKSWFSQDSESKPDCPTHRESPESSDEQQESSAIVWPSTAFIPRIRTWVNSLMQLLSAATNSLQSAASSLRANLVDLLRTRQRSSSDIPDIENNYRTDSGTETET